MHLRLTESGYHQPASLRHEATGTSTSTLHGAVRPVGGHSTSVCSHGPTTWAAITTPDRP